MASPRSSRPSWRASAGSWRATRSRSLGRRLLRAGPGGAAGARSRRPAAAAERCALADAVRAPPARRLAGGTGLGTRRAHVAGRRGLSLDDPRRRPLPGGDRPRGRGSGASTAPTTRPARVDLFATGKGLRYRIPFGEVDDVIALPARPRHRGRLTAGDDGRRRREVRRLAHHLGPLLGRGPLGRAVLRGPGGERGLADTPPPRRAWLEPSRPLARVYVPDWLLRRDGRVGADPR